MRNATRVMIEEDRGLAVLRFARPDVQVSEHELWPSWTPLWQDVESLRIFLSLDYCADNKRPLLLHKPTDHEDDDVLMLDGFQIDSIESVHTIPTKLFDDDHQDLPHGFQSLYRTITEQGGHVCPKLLLLALMAEMFKNQRMAGDADIIESFLDFLLGRAGLSEEEVRGDHCGASPQDNRLESLENLSYQIQVSCRDRSLFLTKNGNIGLGPSERKSDFLTKNGNIGLWPSELKPDFLTKNGNIGLWPSELKPDFLNEGDVIVVLFGGPWPFILRQDGSDYRLVGPCYVSGMMYGEAVRDREAQAVPPRTFQIK
jgi:hypothetical protein